MKIAVFYYTQTGQALQIVQSICAPLQNKGYEIVYKKIEPVKPFPFPWTAESFYQAFPETRLLMPAPIKAIDTDDVADADLVMIAGQSWFLSPSQPIEAFLTDTSIAKYLKGKKVVFINGCRNMWVMSQKVIRHQLSEAGAHYIANIALQDHTPNLISVVTIFRWLLQNKQEASSIWPRAGVSKVEIAGASQYGELIAEALQNNDYESLQKKIVAQKGLTYRRFLVYCEKMGHRMFGLWAAFVRKKGGPNAPERSFRLSLFNVYLMFVLFIISPIGLVIWYLLWPVHCVFDAKEEKDMKYNLKG